MSGCAPGESFGFVSSVVHFVDCQAEVLGTGSWQALATPGSTLSLLLTALLTIFIALIGYNLLLGRGLSVRTGTLAMVKVGIVLALATSWPAYRTLVYDLVVNGPSDLVREIGRPARVTGSDGSLLVRLDLADRALAELALLGPGNPPSDYPQATGQIIVPPPFAGFNAFALGGTRILFLIGSIGAFAAVRLLSALLLALGPFFIAFLLFDNTRSLFEGWVRVLGGAALASFAAALVLGLELGFLEPWLADVLARRLAGEALPSLPTELLVLVSVFTLALIVALFGIAKVIGTFRMAPVIAWAEAMMGSRSAGSGQVDRIERSSSETRSERSRAAAVVEGLTSARGRGVATVTPLIMTSDPQRTNVTNAAVGRASAAEASSRPRLGQTHRRQVRGRASASAGIRDQRT